MADPSPPAAICRDCLTHQNHDVGAGRCQQCGSPRIVAHTELDQLTIGHIDCDAFYAAVEKRDNPELAAKPVIIGGGKRGVVSTACYVARIRGVRSAMPMFKALEACPDAVVIKPDMAKYSKAGRLIRERMKALTPMVEPLSIDEAFLDLGGTQRLHKASPAQVLIRFAREIEEEMGLSVSIGLSYCKFLAKVASDLNKPRGFSVIGRKEALGFLREQPVSIVWGVGKVTQAMLARDGIKKLSTVQDMEESELAKRYGSMGIHLSRLARGQDSRNVSPGSGAKSVSSETTFNHDKDKESELLPVLHRQAERVSERLKKSHIAGQTIVLKLKSANFQTRTRSRQIPDPTQLADRIYRTGAELLKKEIDGTKYRLLGIGVSTLGPDEHADPEDLVDAAASKRAKAERALDEVRGKFGKKSVTYGINFRKS